jgi:hypothetical protein
VVVPVALAGYVLSPDQPTPLNRQFREYGENDCQLPELPNWPANVTATKAVCSAFGTYDGAITVQLTTGPAGNPIPVRYFLNYGTAQQQELTSTVTPARPGIHLVTAVAAISTDSVNNAGNTATFPVAVEAAEMNTCDLPTLAFTGASGALTALGASALLLMLGGAAVLVARRRQV